MDEDQRPQTDSARPALPSYSKALAPTIATPSAAAKRWDRARRGLGSRWVGLGVGAVAGAALFAPVSWLAPVGLLGSYIGSTFILRHRVRRFMSRMLPAYHQAERGSFELAIETCRDGMTSEPWPVSHLCGLTLAYFLRRSGELDKAIEINGLAAKTDDGLLRRAIGAELAVCYALKGATGPAMTWLPAYTRRLGPLAPSYGIVWMLTGKRAQLSRLHVRASRAVAPFVRHETRLLALLKAFSHYKDNPTYLSIRPMLLEAGPAYASEFNYLGGNWPEMAEFVDTYVSPASD